MRLRYVYTNSSESPDIVFLVDVTVNDTCAQWRHTLSFLTNFVKYIAPTDSSYAVILIKQNALRTVSFKQNFSEEQMVEYFETLQTSAPKEERDLVGAIDIAKGEFENSDSDKIIITILHGAPTGNNTFKSSSFFKKMMSMGSSLIGKK